VQAAVTQLATDVSTLPWLIRTGEKAEDPELERGPLRELLKQPNPMYGFPGLLNSATQYLIGAGRSHWIMDTLTQNLDSGKVKQLRRVRPDYMIARVGEFDEIGGWEYQPTGRMIPVDGVVFFSLFDPIAPTMGGLSPLVSIDLALAMLRLAARWNMKFFEKGARPSITVALKNALTEAAEKRYRAQIQSEQQGVDNAFDVLIFDEAVEIKAFESTHDDMGFENLMRLGREEVLAATHVPPAIAGDYKHLNLAQVEVQERLYWSKTVIPMATQIAETINRTLVPRVQPGVWFHFDYSKIKVLQEDLDAKVRRDAIEVSHGLRSRKELRERDGHQPYPGSDKFLISAGLVATDQDGARPPKGDPAGEQAGARALAKRIMREPVSTPTPREIERAAAWRGFAAKLDRAEERIELVWRGELERMAEHVAARIRKRPPEVPARWALDILTRQGDEDVPLGIPLPEPIIFYLPTPEILIAELTRRHGRVYQAILEEFGAAAIRRILDDLVFDAGTPSALKLVERDAVRIGKEVELLLNAIRDDLESGLKAGESIGDLIHRIKATVAGSSETARLGGPSVRSERIARTESVAAANAGSFEGMRQGGVSRHEWLSSRDEWVRETHDTADGQTVSLGEPFQVGDGQLLYPGDPDGPAGETVNCVPGDTVVSGRVVGALRAHYAGKMLEIRTARGHRLRITPNHPVLTDLGFVPASSLRQGDKVISELCVVERHRSVDDEYNAPSRIDDVFQALSDRWPISKLSAVSLDLHGDAASVQGEIEVVGSHDALLGDMQATGTEDASKFMFVGRRITQGAFRMQGASQHGTHRLRPAPSSLPGRGAVTLNRRPRRLQSGPLQMLSLGSAAQFDTSRYELRTKGGSGESDFIRELLQRGTGFIAPDEILEIRNVDFCGHVYDLQTEGGWYSAQGVCQSNCRCTTIPVVDEAIAA